MHVIDRLVNEGENPYEHMPILDKITEPYPFLRYAWEAFFKLSNGRGVISGIDGSSYAPLTFDAIYYYAKIYGYDNPDDFDELELYLRTLDNAYLKYNNDKRATR